MNLLIYTRVIPAFLCDAYLDNVNCFISAIRNNRTYKGASYLKRSFPTVTANRLYEAIRMLLIVKLQFQVMSVPKIMSQSVTTFSCIL